MSDFTTLNYSTKRGASFASFARKVADHIENYTVPQYGDSPNDAVEEYTVEDCIKQAEKYLKRYGKNQREGQQELDFLKACHYVQLAAEKYEKLVDNKSELK